jgi:hypothetical protein
VFLNPPGGKRANRSLAELFWDRLIEHSESEPGFAGAIFVGFSIEALATTQRSRRPILAYPLCVPRKRIAFVPGFSETGAAGKKSPSHSNVIVYVPGFGSESRVSVFARHFGELGYVRE